MREGEEWCSGEGRPCFPQRGGSGPNTLEKERKEEGGRRESRRIQRPEWLEQLPAEVPGSVPQGEEGKGWGGGKVGEASSHGRESSIVARWVAKEGGGTVECY